LDEIARVVKKKGRRYVAVPDASTFSDRIYRWLAHGGGHVDAIVDAAQFVKEPEARTGLKVTASRLLHTSFAFANIKGPVRGSRRVWLIGGGARVGASHCQLLCAALRCLTRDALECLRVGIYLGEMASIDDVPSTNVWVRCGAAHVSEWLKAVGEVKSGWCCRSYRCPECRTENAFTDDDHPRLI